MTRRSKDAAMGVVTLVVVAALITLSILFYNHAFTSYVTVRARTGSIGNSLQKGADVQVRGVLVGQVSGTSTDGSGAVIYLDLDPAKVRSLPSDMTVQLLPKTLFGERYVSLQLPTGPRTGHLRSGDVLDQDRSPGAIELDKLFADLLPVLQSLEPDKLSSVLGSLATTLRGQGDDLYRTVSAVTHFVNGLLPHVPQLASDLNALVSVAHTYTQAGPDLVQALNSLTTVSETVAQHGAEVHQLLKSVTTTANVLGDFVGTNQDQIIGLASDSLPSLRTLARYAGEFPCLSRTLVNFIPVANRAFGAGSKRPGAHVVLHVVARVKPYTEADRVQSTSASSARCPYSPTTSLAATALSQVPGVTGANLLSPATAASSSSSATSNAASSSSSNSATAAAGTGGIGPANSPQENELIAELVAPTVGMAPSAFPRWSSLLLGPSLRGTEVSVK